MRPPHDHVLRCVSRKECSTTDTSLSVFAKKKKTLRCNISRPVCRKMMIFERLNRQPPGTTQLRVNLDRGSVHQVRLRGSCGWGDRLSSFKMWGSGRSLSCQAWFQASLADATVNKFCLGSSRSAREFRALWRRTLGKKGCQEWCWKVPRKSTVWCGKVPTISGGTSTKGRTGVERRQERRVRFLHSR